MISVSSQPVATVFVRGDDARAEVRRQAPQRVLLVALDVGKDVHMLSMRTAADEEVLAPTKVPSLAEGYAFFQRQVQTALDSEAYDLVLIGHEPTGIYHEAWSARIAADFHDYRSDAATPALRYRLLQPTLVKRARQQKSQRRRKTDKLDVAAIADLLAQGVGDPVVPLGQTEWTLRHLAARTHALHKEHKRLGNRILRTFDRLWPGALGNVRGYQRIHADLPTLRRLVTSRPLTRDRVRFLLEQAITPHDLADLDVEAVRQLFHQHGLRCGPKTAQHVLAVVHQSLLPPAHVAALLAQQLQSEFANYSRQEEEIAHMEGRMETLLPQTSAQILTTFPGISPLLAARYLAGLGHPARFQTPQQIWAFAGLDPSQSDSGNSRRSGAISHRGSPYLRNTLYQIGYMASHHCPDAARTYHRARNRGKPVAVAILHVANKTNRILWRLLQTQQPYQSPLSDKEE